MQILYYLQILPNVEHYSLSICFLAKNDFAIFPEIYPYKTVNNEAANPLPILSRPFSTFIATPSKTSPIIVPIHPHNISNQK